MAKRPKPIEIGPVRASTMNRWREQDGAVLWYWRARRKGERDTLWTGWATREVAQEELAKVVTKGLPTPREVRPTISTLGHLLDAWYDGQEERPDLSPRTIDRYQKGARHLIAWLRDVLVERLDRETLERYRTSRLGEGCSPRLLVQELKVLGMAWKWGQDCGHVPARTLPRLAVKIEDFRINHRTPEPEEIPRVLAALSGELALVVEILAVTGARVGEVCGLRVGDLHPRTGDLTLRGKTGKRTFPLPSALVKKLASRLEQPAQTPLLTIAPKAAEQVVRDRLARACKAAKVTVFTPHGLRRMVVDRMIRSGVDVATAASLTGHSVEVMLRHYRQVSEDDRRSAVQKARLGSFPVRGKVLPLRQAEEG